MLRKMKSIAAILTALTMIWMPLSGYADESSVPMPSETTNAQTVSFESYIMNFEYAKLLTKEDYAAAKKYYDASIATALKGDYKTSGEQFKACYLILYKYEKQFNLTRPIQTKAEVLKYAPTNMTAAQKKKVEALYAQMLKAYQKKDANLYDGLSKKMQTMLTDIYYVNLPYLSASDKKKMLALTTELEKYNYVTQTNLYDATYKKINSLLEKYIPEQRAYELKQALIQTQKTTAIPKADLEKLNQYIASVQKSLKAKNVSQSEQYMVAFNQLLRKYQSKMFISAQNENIDDMAKSYGWTEAIISQFKDLIVKIDEAEIKGAVDLESQYWEAYEGLMKAYAHH